MKQFIGLLFAALIILQLITCTAKDSGKIPITTKSQEALAAYLQGRDLSERLRDQESITFFEKAIELDPEFAMAHLNYADVHPTAKGFFEHLNIAVRLVDKVSDGEKLQILGLQANANADILKQNEYYQKLVAAYPQDERAYTLLGSQYFRQQDWQAAIDNYNHAITINPKFSQPYNQMGYAYRFLEKYDQAVDAFKKYIELIPDDPNPYDSYAELLMKMGKFEESIANYKKALEINPNFVASHIGIATNLNFLQRHQDAQQQLDTLWIYARNVGEQREALLSKAVSYADQGKNNEAINCLEQAYGIAEKDSDVTNMAGDLILIGNILLEERKSKEAAEKFASSLAIIKKSSLPNKVKQNAENDYLYNMCRVDLQEKNLPDTKQNADLFLKRILLIKNPNQLRLAYEIFGRIALAENDFEAAIKVFNQANLQNPYNLYYLSLAYQGAKKPDEADKYLQKAKYFYGLDGFEYAFVRQKIAAAN